MIWNWKRLAVAAAAASLFATLAAAQGGSSTGTGAPPGSTGTEGVGRGSEDTTGGPSSSPQGGTTGAPSGSTDTEGLGRGSESTTGGPSASPQGGTTGAPSGSTGTEGLGRGSETTTGGPSPSTKPLPKSVSDAAQNLHADNQAMIQLGQLAQTNAQAPEVKDFARMMVEDHTKNDTKLQTLAEQSGIQLEGAAFQGRQAKRQQGAQKLSAKQGAAFDKAYMSAMVSTHKADAKALDQATKTAKQAGATDLAAFFASTDKAVKGHLSHAQAVQKTANAEKTAAGASPSGSMGTGSSSMGTESGSMGASGAGGGTGGPSGSESSGGGTGSSSGGAAGAGGGTGGQQQ